MKLKKILLDWKVLILIVTLFFTLLAIKPDPWAKGVVITRIEPNSSIAEQSISTNEIILSINNEKITNLQDYTKIVSKIPIETQKITIVTNKNTYAFLEAGPPEITVKNIELTNIQKGLDLAGGTRVLLKPVGEKITDQQLSNLVSILKTRLDVYGISDLTVREAKDLSGNKYVLVEVTGATKEEVKDLIAQQGKFEAKIGKETVFRGEKEDIRYVCKDDGSCSGISSCNQIDKGYMCKFEFQVTLSNEAAKRHAEVTSKLNVNVTDARYLDQKIDFFLDNNPVDSLLIGADLKGKETTGILISGPGFGSTKEDAIIDASKNMNKLQTILLVGSLPFDLEISKMDTISPVLGIAFIKNIFLVSIVAILSVALVILIRYKKLKIVIPIIITMLSEIVIVLGFAALIKWRLDLASIAGILASVGTGVDDQIVITDEVLSGQEGIYNWKERMKRAFFIILAAYATTVAAMIPLWNAGAGLVRGFALTTIVGVTIGVFITRPAFASMIENLLKE